MHFQYQEWGSLLIAALLFSWFGLDKDGKTKYTKNMLEHCETSLWMFVSLYLCPVCVCVCVFVCVSVCLCVGCKG